MKVCSSQSEYKVQTYLPLISFVQISSNFWNLVRIFTWVGEVLKSLPECLSVAPAHQAARWHWLALTGSVLCLRPRLRAPSVPALSRLRLRPSAPALTLRSPHWHRLDTTGSMIISQLQHKLFTDNFKLPTKNFNYFIKFLWSLIVMQSTKISFDSITSCSLPN